MNSNIIKAVIIASHYFFLCSFVSTNAINKSFSLADDSSNIKQLGSPKNLFLSSDLRANEGDDKEILSQKSDRKRKMIKFLSEKLSKVNASITDQFNEWQPVIKELNTIMNIPVVAAGCTMVSILAFYALLTKVVMHYQMKGLLQVDFNTTKNGGVTFKDYIGDIPQAALDLVDQLNNQEKYEDLNIPITKGILLYGPAGSGKTFLARAIAGEVGCPFFAINAADFNQTFVGQARIAIKTLFKKAYNDAWWSSKKTAVIFIDELDAIGKRNGSAATGSSIEIINTLLSEMDGFIQKKNVTLVVIGATNRVESLDAALKRTGRLDYKIHVPLLDSVARKKLIFHLCKTFPTASTCVFDDIIQKTEGFSAAEIKFMFELAGRYAVLNHRKRRNYESFIKAIEEIQREKAASKSDQEMRIDSFNVANQNDTITFKDYIGGIPEAALDIVLQLKKPAQYAQLNVPMTKGVLLHGPAGSGKTYLARAIAGEVGCPFIAVNGTYFTESLVGQSKMAVKDLFETAQQLAKTNTSKTAIIFIDEIDAIGNRSCPGSSASTEIINTLLSQMDGFSKQDDINIIVFAATNLVSALDPALKRSGRFDYKIHVPYLDEPGRKLLIEYYIKQYPCYISVDSAMLAQKTHNFSQADIKFMFELAGRIAIRACKKLRDNQSFISAIDQINQNNKESENHCFLPTCG